MFSFHLERWQRGYIVQNKSRLVNSIIIKLVQTIYTATYAYGEERRLLYTLYYFCGLINYYLAYNTWLVRARSRGLKEILISVVNAQSHGD